MTRVLIVGAKGQVGSELCPILLDEGYEIVATCHSSLDVTNENEVSATISNLRLDAVINVSAYTQVDKAESEYEKAYAVNAKGPQYLALACRSADIPLIHVSTDYVFDKVTGKPHTPYEETFANCAYGKTKLEGERLIASSSSKYVIIRTSWVFGRYGKNFVKAIFNKALTTDNLMVVTDELGNPTPARALAYAIAKVCTKCLSPDFKDWGIYHYSGMPYLNRAEFAQEIVKIGQSLGKIQHEVKVNPILKAQLGLAAKRPDDSRLDCESFTSVFGLSMPIWRDYIEETVLYD